MNIYAVYKGDKFIDVGTAEEIAEKLKIKKRQVYWYASAEQWKKKKHRLDIFKLEEE